MKTSRLGRLTFTFALVSALTLVFGFKAESETQVSQNSRISDQLLFDESSVGFYAANGFLNDQQAYSEAHDRAVALCQILAGKQYIFPFYEIGRSVRSDQYGWVKYRIPTMEGNNYWSREVISRYLGLSKLEHYEFKSLSCSIPPTPTPVQK